MKNIFGRGGGSVLLVLGDVTISSSIPVLLAQADLKMIQSVLNAMDIADMAGAAMKGEGPLPNQVGRMSLDVDRVELSGGEGAAAISGHVDYRTDRLELTKGAGPIGGHEATKLWGQSLTEVEAGAGCVVQAPWEVRIWNEAPKLDVGPTIKCVVHPPDHPVKGRLIDLLG